MAIHKSYFHYKLSILQYISCLSSLMR